MTTMHEYAVANANAAEEIDIPEDGKLSIPLVRDMLAVLKHDNAREFKPAKDYLEGKHLKPYAPQNTTAQIRDMQKRAITNLMPLLVGLPSQVCFVDGYRRGTFGEKDKGGDKAADKRRFSPEYEEWQKGNMDARQAVIYRAALTYGQSFVQVEKLPGQEDLKINILATRRTIAFFDDPANDLRPQVVVTYKRYPTKNMPGLILAWDGTYRYEIKVDDKDGLVWANPPIKHGAKGCPVIRYTCYLDDEGTSKGVVNASKVAQDRVNQAAFSTDVTAAFGAFKVRTASGLQPTFKTDAKGELLLDPVTNQPIPEPIEVSQAKILMSDDPETKFGQLDETPVDGYLRAEEQAIRNFAALNQFPPHTLLGNISNLSAEALAAAEKQLTRFIGFLQTSWGGSHEELFRLISEVKGDEKGATAYGGEVRWRKVTEDAFPAVVDALGKLVQMVGLPQRAAWAMVPEVTSGMLEDWEKLKDEQDQEMLDAAMAGPDVAAQREYRPQPSHAQVNRDSSATTRSAADGRANV